MKYCMDCGAELPIDHAKFCPECGESLPKERSGSVSKRREADPKATSPKAKPPDPQKSERPASHIGRLEMWSAVGVVVAAVGLLFGLFFGLRGACSGEVAGNLSDSTATSVQGGGTAGHADSDDYDGAVGDVLTDLAENLPEIEYDGQGIPVDVSALEDMEEVYSEAVDQLGLLSPPADSATAHQELSAALEAVSLAWSDVVTAYSRSSDPSTDPDYRSATITLNQALAAWDEVSGDVLMDMWDLE